MRHIILTITILIFLAGCVYNQPTRTAQNVIDDEMFEKAIAEEDINLCDKIQSEIFKNSCITEVSILLGDETGCDKAGSSKDYCFIGVANQTNKHELCENVKEGEYRDICYKNVAVGLKDETLCEEVWGDETYSDCYKEVAEAALNETICKQVQLKNKQNWCIVNIALAKEDHKICDLIRDSIDRQSLCDMRVAELTQNKEICEEMTAPQIKERCEKLFE